MHPKKKSKRSKSKSSSRDKSPVLSGRQSIETFLLNLQAEHPHTSFRFWTLLHPLVETYGSMRKLAKQEIKSPHKLERKGVNIKREKNGKALDNQIGQRSKCEPDFFEHLDAELERRNENPMPAGAKHLLANAIVNWCLNYLEQR